MEQKSMRLFIAILFDPEVEASLFQTVEKLKSVSEKGTFTTRENLHLTVNFIGETKRVDEVKKAMNQAVRDTNASEFVLNIRGIGKFKRREGDIYWIGAEQEKTLWKLQRTLVRKLKDAGFYEIDDMEYTPHLTLGRRVVPAKGFLMSEFGAAIHPVSISVKKLNLMKSERINGKLVYTELYSVALNQSCENE